MLKTKKNIHFVGVGGIGMSALAKILVEMGSRVSGSDLEMNSLTEKLKALGAKIYTGHRTSHLTSSTGLVVYSSSIVHKNPELVRARRLGIPVVQRATVLGELLNSRLGVAVTGTHGKTTTTSLIAVMLAKSGLDPTVAVGGEVAYFQSNARRGGGAWMVAEADESDGSFSCLRPFYAVVTNIEMEHIDYYKTLGDVVEAYAGFVNNTRRGGVFFYNNDDPNVRSVLKLYAGESRSFGLKRGATIYPVNVRLHRSQTMYTCVYRGRRMGTVRLGIPGAHNILNSLAAILVGLEMGLDFKRIARSLEDFKGAKRRFEVRFDQGGIMLVDDYAHHPTEIRAVIEAARSWKPKRLIVVFQPHRYTRTKYLKKEFGACFAGADRLILTDIYAASEPPIAGVSVRSIYDEVKKGGKKDVVILEKKEISSFLLREVKRGDMIIIMGAGDIKKVADETNERLWMRATFGRVRGVVRYEEPLARHTTFRIGGPARVWIEPRDIRDLRAALKICTELRLEIFVIGKGSNLLAPDGGWNGAVISLDAPSFRRRTIDGTKVTVGAGYNFWALVRELAGRGLGGLESLVGIPGTVGGAIRMNAGGAANPIFTNIGAYVKTVKVMDFNGRIRTLEHKELSFGYRSSNLSKVIILEAVLALVKADRAILLRRLEDFLRLKRSKQVLDMPSAGCIFKNPPDLQFTAGQLIDMMGFKGQRLGGAFVSEKHANFIVNAGGATAEDVMALAETIRKRARQIYRIPLEMEVKVL